MKYRDFSLFAIRIFAIYLFVKGASFSPLVELQTMRVSGFFPWLVSLAGILLVALAFPALVWYLAPKLSRWVASGLDHQELTDGSVNVRRLYLLGISLLGLSLIPFSITMIVGYTYQLFTGTLPEGVDVVARFELDSSLRGGILRSLIQLILGLALFLRPGSFLKVVEKFDRSIGA